MFSSKSNEQGNQFESSIFNLADPSKLEGFLLEGNKDHVLNQARSELMKQKQQVNSLDNCVGAASATSLCSKIGITGRTTRIC